MRRGAACCALLVVAHVGVRYPSQGEQEPEFAKRRTDDLAPTANHYLTNQLMLIIAPLRIGCAQTPAGFAQNVCVGAR
jgi:hypothetical protein